MYINSVFFEKRTELVCSERINKKHYDRYRATRWAT